MRHTSWWGAIFLHQGRPYDGCPGGAVALYALETARTGRPIPVPVAGAAAAAASSETHLRIRNVAKISVRMMSVFSSGHMFALQQAICKIPLVFTAAAEVATQVVGGKVVRPCLSASLARISSV
jgi:hypothetical protein